MICVDEKPGIQALKWKTGYVETHPRQRQDRARLQKHLQASGMGHSICLPPWRWQPGRSRRRSLHLKRREEFLQFMDQVVAQTPGDRPEISRHLMVKARMMRMFSSSKKSLGLRRGIAGWPCVINPVIISQR